MTEGEFQVVRAIGFIAAVSLAMAAQALSPHARQRGSGRVNWALWLLDLAVIGAVCGACAYSAARWAETRQLGLFHHIGVAHWLAVLMTILVLDLVSYIWHRANHEVPILWRFHQVHHSDPAFTVSTGLRFHPGELLLSLPVRLIAVVGLGASPVAVVAFETLFAIANLVEHGDIDLPRSAEAALNHVCITPALHRLHHSRDWERMNTNFGTLFVLWDRSFGSYKASSSDVRVETGLPNVEATHSLRQALLLPVHAGSRVQR